MIRFATPNDVPAIARLHALSQRTAYADLLHADALARIDDDTWITRWTDPLASSAPRARAFYECNGWQLAGPGDDHAIAGHPVETVRYTRSLFLG